jgi:hypothetical protein
MESKRILLADLVDMDSPTEVLAEVRTILGLLGPEYVFPRVDRAFADVLALYGGTYPGYRRCTTDYHDLRHTTDVFLVLARLMHGALVDGTRITPFMAELALTSALLHDTGYIQTADDLRGTGGKYTFDHVERSIAFLADYFAGAGFSREEEEACRDMVLCTAVTVDVGSIPFVSPEAELLAKMTATADFLGQIADRFYLEKLLFLYREFREAGMMEYGNELELLRKTVGFYHFFRNRLAHDLGNVQRFLAGHFRERWGIKQDLYQTAVRNNMAYLELVLTHHEEDYRNQLKRGGFIERLRHAEARDRRSAAQR